MATEHYYDVTLEWRGMRKGELSSSVLSKTIEVATPPEFPQGMPDIWSPEHLFVAAINSCLMTTFLAIAENSKLSFLSFRSKATGKLEAVNGKYMISQVLLEPQVVIADEAQKDRAQRILEKAEANCLISNSVKSAIVFKPQVQVVVDIN